MIFKMPCCAKPLQSVSPRLQPTRLLCPSDFVGKNTEVGCRALLQGLFLTREFWVINSENTLFIRTDEQVINSEELISADLYWSVFFLPFPPFLFPQ